MELVLDNSKTYAIALEGGGAKGAYEIGAWQALEEAGIKYKAVSGTSVGALNGSLMAMRDLEKAVAVWHDIRLSQVIDLGNTDEAEFKRLVSGGAEFNDLQEFAPQMLGVVRNRGLDVGPLRAWIKEVVDERRLKESDVDLYVSTVSLSDRKGLEIKINDLPEDEMEDMLLASAYHPTFKMEPLGGKYYADGGFVDSLPLHVLVENGWKDIIAIRIPGMGILRRFKMPADVKVTYIEPHEDLGGVLNFDAEQSRRDMRIGYFDAKRTLYGLYGEHYYIDRTMSDEEALGWLFRCYIDRDDFTTLRKICENELPQLARHLHLGSEDDYYELMIAVLENEAERLGIDNLQILTDTEFMELIAEAENRE